MRIDKLAASVPANRTAATVTQKSGDNYAPPEAIFRDREGWDDNPGTRPYPPHATRLDGHKSGRLTVIGFSRTVHPSKGKRGGARYLVRCACGRYEERKLKALIRCGTDDDCCAICNHTKRLRYLSSADQEPSGSAHR